ncbi:MAG: DUF1343 domain-containing protein [Prevotellaceae bacterium]|jgi:uncharacterized protein YbbC (DUF1343 family)|nr:DUF1343 domain-containing protein [Prevotellaceae bacterium]
MKKQFLTAIVLISGTALCAQPQVKLGIDVLRDRNFDILQGKRVGLVTNPTGVDRFLKSTVDILFEAENVTLVALYGPEHGVRGDVPGGGKIEDAKDEKTGLPIYSLYGATRKPTREMVKDVDVLVYDIQDIGCRSYTYISTMGLVMEACADYGLECVVLDRPNPLGGEKVEGCLTEDGNISFVSQFKIPYVYGLTCGELATMLNQEEMISGRCALTVVPMEGWNRSMDFTQTGLSWVPTSPHIPEAVSSLFYVTTGILGELYVVSIGVGYTLPFQLVASDLISAQELADRLNSIKIEGVFFRPIYVKPYYSVGKDLDYQGVQIHIIDPVKVVLSDIQFYIMQEMYALNPKLDFFSMAPNRIRMWNQVSGSDFIFNEFSKGYRFDSIRDYWHKDDESFKKKSAKYYLYQ